jgi:hypothetical protein
VAIRDRTGALRGYFKIMRDRTDLRMNVELRANQVEALEDAMRRMQQSIETVGHELRNPLALPRTSPRSPRACRRTRQSTSWRDCLWWRTPTAFVKLYPTS